jgi:hypothetical protein
MITAYRVLLVLKLLGVLLFAGGLIAAALVADLADRRRAVHGVASPGLALTWLAGYGLALLTGVPLGELWVVGGLALSLVAQLALVHSVTRGGPRSARLAVAPLVAVLVLMVFRPVWP